MAAASEQQLENALKQFALWLAVQRTDEADVPDAAERADWEAKLRDVSEESWRLAAAIEQLPAQQRAEAMRRLGMINRTVELGKALLAKWGGEELPEWAATEFVCRCGKKFFRGTPEQEQCSVCLEPDANVRAQMKFRRAFKAFAMHLKDELSDEEVRAVARVSLSETGMLLLEDDSGIGFVFHGVFGKLLSAAEAKRVSEAAATTPPREHVGTLLNGFGPVEVEDHLSGVTNPEGP